MPALAETPSYDVTITRTTYGIPHIKAGDYGSLSYGTGYTAAEDALCPIAENILTARGERSRYFGEDGTISLWSSAITNLESDIFHKALGDLEELRKRYHASSPEFSASVKGFVAGYNRYLEDHRSNLPEPCAGADWIQNMTEDDLLLIIHSGVLAHGMGTAADEIVTARPPGTASAEDQNQVSSFGDGVPLFGSNGWAFGGEATANGRGLLVGNPHQPWQGRQRFRQLHLTIPGEVDVMGAGPVSQPFVIFGFNKDTAWTHTTSTAQHYTLFELALDPQDPTSYIVDGVRERMKRRTVTIELANGESVTHTVYMSRYGPVLSAESLGLEWTSSKAFAVRDANLFNLRGGEAWLRIARARTVEDIFDAVAETLGVPYLNTLAADREGDTIYADITAMPNVSLEHIVQCGTKVGADPRLRNARIAVLDGSSSSCDWQIDPTAPVEGLMPAKSMPSLKRRDYVQNSNDSYWLTNPASPFPQFSPLIGMVGTPQSFRTRSGIMEIQRHLEGRDGNDGQKIEQHSAKALILANESMAAEQILDDLLTLCSDQSNLAEACQTLANWDRRANLDSRGALLFFGFLRHAAAVKDKWRVRFDPANPVDTPRGLRQSGPEAEAILAALGKAAMEMRAAGAPLDVPLGAVQRTPRGGDVIPIHGGPRAAGLLNQVRTRLDGRMLVPYYGTSYLQVVGFDDQGPVADAILTYSQSADPASPHHADQTRNFSAKLWHRLPFTPEDIVQEQISQPLRLIN